MLRYMLLLALISAAVWIIQVCFPLRLPYDQSDLAAYKISFDRFIQGANPYDSKVIEAAWREKIGSNAALPLMVWNPPLLFAFPGALMALSEDVIFPIWPFILTAAAFCLSVLGAKLSGATTSGVRLTACLSLLLSFPFWYEIYLSQLSSLLALIPIIGLFLFLGGRDFPAGILLSVAMLKPHVVFLPAVAAVFWAIVNRRWGFFIGGITGITISILGLELLSPGIWLEWIFRETWPMNYIGAVASDVLQKWLLTIGITPPSSLKLLVPLIGAIGICIYLYRRAAAPDANVLVWAMLFNPIFTPYGFVFDQSILVLVQAYIIARSPTAALRRIAWLLIALINVTTFLAMIAVRTEPPYVWWFLYPPILILAAAYLQIRMTVLAKRVA